MLNITIPVFRQEGHLSSAGGEVLSPTLPCNSPECRSAFAFLPAAVYNWLPAGPTPPAELTSSTRLKMIQLYHHTYLLLRLHTATLCRDLPFTLSNFTQPHCLVCVHMCVSVCVKNNTAGLQLNLRCVSSLCVSHACSSFSLNSLLSPDDGHGSVNYV